MIFAQNLFKNLPFQKKIKNATSLRVAWRKYYYFDTSDNNFNK